MIVVIRLFCVVERGEIRSECWVLWLETGVFVVGFTDLYVGFRGLEFGLRVSELGSEGLNWGFRFFLYLFSGFAFLITAVFVGEAAKVRCKVPKWLRFMGFARWVLAVANRVRRVGSGFNRAFHLENGCSDCKNGVFVFRFLYFSGLVRRNSFVNVVFAVGDMAKVRCKVPKWL